MMLETLLVLLASFTSICALAPHKIKNLVTFGDSFTDVVNTGDGGVAWPAYAASYSNASLFPFARAGATCSNNITFRPFPSLFESQLPLYFNRTNNGSLILNPKETLYTLWIGTNDVGSNALLTGNGAPGVSVVETTACAVNWVKVLYQSGARNFLFQNMVPLEFIPLYAPVSYPNRYWTKERNTTEWSILMHELTRSGNEISRLLLEALAPTLRGAHVGIFDSHSLFQDMIEHPDVYFNGTAPLNTTGSIRACVFELNEPTSDPGVCTIANGTDADSFLWFDELHPSEQADRVVARQIADVIQGKKNRWTRWLS